MGAIVSIFVAIGEAVAATGLAAETIISGEAAAILGAQISSLVAEGFTTAEALSTLGLTPELFAFTTSLASAAESGGALWTGLASGLYSLGGAGVSGIAGGLQGGIATAAAGLVRFPNISKHRHEMALQIWQPLDWLYPEAEWLYNAYHYFDPYSWLPSLMDQLGSYFWEYVERTGHRQLTSQATAVAVRATNRAWYTLMEQINNAGWFIRNGYYALEHYYRVLPPRFGPPRLRQYLEANRDNVFIDPPDMGSDTSENRFEGDFLKRLKKIFNREQESGERVYRSRPPGGAEQMVTPDWLLPLILGLLGDLTPTFAADIRRYGSENRKRKATSTSTPPANKRRNRGTRPKDRRRLNYNSRGLSKSQNGNR